LIAAGATKNGGMVMLGIDGLELLLIIFLLILVVGPKDLPKVMRVLGNIRARMHVVFQELQDHLRVFMDESERNERHEGRDSLKKDSNPKRIIAHKTCKNEAVCSDERLSRDDKLSKGF
jgi:sec-independent protein translocase protein TatB